MVTKPENYRYLSRDDRTRDLGRDRDRPRPSRPRPRLAETETGRDPRPIETETGRDPRPIETEPLGLVTPLHRIELLPFSFHIDYNSMQ
jgi:hypothetical protein